MYFVALCLIYILFFLDMSFKLTILKTKCFQKIVENRKTKYLSFSSVFLRGLFYRLKLTFQISDNIGLCTSRCIIIIAVSGQDKSMKKITQNNFLYIYSPTRNRTGSNNFFRGVWVWKNSLKLINGGEGLQ